MAVLLINMHGPKRQTPYSVLGEHLKHLRETRKETLAEVSGALEIEVEMLERIERGEERPSEDILTLLISYFSLREHEAMQLWDWAGFSRTEPRETLSDLSSKAALVLVALDARVLYSDGVSIAANDGGLVMNFLQDGVQSASQMPVPIARIGMSYEQAQRLLSVLEQTILRHTYLPNMPLLPPGAPQE